MTRSAGALFVLLLVLTACTTTPDPSPSADTTAAVETTVMPEETTTTTLLAGTEDLPDEVRVTLAELIEATESVRQLTFIEPPAITVVTEAELAARVREDLEENLDDVPADEALYRLLGLIEPDTDLELLYLDLYSEQVAGFYDGETAELVVPVTDEGFTVVQRATLVHELTHALTDQHYDFHDLYSTLLDEERYDESSAYQSLIEGDAVLAELLYLQRLPEAELQEYIDASLEIDSPILDDAPQFIRDSLVFPYDTGFAFVLDLNDSGGFDSIAAAYDDPPRSSEQIIDPDDYPADGPIELDLPPIEVEGFENQYSSTWGELGFALMFDQILGPASSDIASGGWGGDSYTVLFDGTEVGLALAYRGDTASDAEELAAALREYAVAAMAVGESSVERDSGEAYEDEDFVWIRVDGADLAFVAGSSESIFDGAIEDLSVMFLADE